MTKKRGLFGKSYDTLLPPEKERAFLNWAGSKIADTHDYDLRGAWLANAKQAQNRHFPDKFKKPNHPTFSNESIYSSPENMGGTWQDGQNGWSFWASPSNLRSQTTKSLWDYFKNYEPDAGLILPSLGYSLQRGRK